MARNRPCSSAKGKGKAYDPPTRASPRLTALRTQSAVNPLPETPVTPAVITPTSSLPPKKHHIQKAAGEGTSKVAARSFRRRSQRIVAIGKDEDVKEDPKKGPEEAHQDAGMEEEEEDLEEDPEEENAAEEGVREEDDFANC
ncbi:hypothetical protein PIB30_083864 [Stylosanthes scabra]|uniref:Uncharacterized protein n=1 Tax=Stylosanthes scabra TaxID=79078 RepID=A0ABU6XTH3_9FABA|nr:hypothetical protein [Stylosanthes scabra]